MRLNTRLLLAAVFLSALSAPSTAAAQQAPQWPDRWLGAGIDFGSLTVKYRLTDDCDIDPDFEITESPNLDVTREEILDSLTSFLAVGTRDDIPRDVVMAVVEDRFGPEGIPTRPMTKSEYDELMADLDELGPWPRLRIAPVSGNTYRCSFDLSGELTRVERSDAGRDLYSDFDESLSDQGPFTLRWVIEE